MIDQVYDPVTKKAQDIPFKSGTNKNDGEFDENYLKF